MTKLHSGNDRVRSLSRTAILKGDLELGHTLSRAVTPAPWICVVGVATNPADDADPDEPPPIPETSGVRPPDASGRTGPPSGPRPANTEDPWLDDRFSVQAWDA